MATALTYQNVTVNIEPLDLPGRLAEIQARTIEQVVADPQHWIDAYYQKFGNVNINSDDAKTLFPEYDADPLANVQGVHEASSIIAKLIFRLRLIELPEDSLIMLTAGGPASGKTHATGHFEADLIYDSVMKSADGNRELIDQIAETPHKCVIFYVLRGIEASARSNIARSRKHRRVVPVEILAKGHFHSQKVFVEDTHDYASNNGVTVFYYLVVEDAEAEEILFEEFAKMVHTDYAEVLRKAREASYEEIESNRDDYDERVGDALEGGFVEPLDGRADSRNEAAGEGEFDPDV